MLSITKKGQNNNKKELSQLRIRRNTISKSKILKKEYQTKQITLIFVKMFKELTNKLNENHYQVSCIRIHLQDSNQNSIRFSLKMETPTSNFSKLLKLILPTYISKVKQGIIITKIAISFEKLTIEESKSNFSIKKLFYKKLYQN